MTISNSEPDTGTESNAITIEPNRDEEMVKIIDIIDLIKFICNNNHLSKCRKLRKVSEGATAKATYEDSHRLDIIIATHFINYLLSTLFIYYHYSRTTMSNASLSLF